jgi:hypothetical protein
LKIRKFVPVLFLFIAAFSLTILPATDAFATSYKHYYKSTFSDSVWIGGGKGKVFKATDGIIKITINKSNKAKVCYQLHTDAGTYVNSFCTANRNEIMNFATRVGKRYKFQIVSSSGTRTTVSGNVFY